MNSRSIAQHVFFSCSLAVSCAWVQACSCDSKNDDDADASACVGTDCPPSGVCNVSTDCTGGLICLDNRCVMLPAECSIVDACCQANGCVDVDCDGYGDGCLLGPDCDDTNAQRASQELCFPPDGIDNDCDGSTDEFVTPACECNPNCQSNVVGPGWGGTFDVMSESANSVSLDPNGFLVISATQSNYPYIWIVNTGDGTVSKVDTEDTNADGTFKEVARYFTGPLIGYGGGAGGASCGPGNDPSRTSINTLGHAYVANRCSRRVTKFGSSLQQCLNGGVTSSFDVDSSGHIEPNEVHAWPDDDCMLWSVELPLVEQDPPLTEDRLRAIAAQDYYGSDGSVSQYVWVGGWTSKTIWKLDGLTGEIVVETSIPGSPYGFALDAQGQLWIASREVDGSQNWLVRVDTTRCTSTAACDEAFCGPEDDSCIKQQMLLPPRDGFGTSSFTSQPYGVTVDRNRIVWVGGNFRQTGGGARIGAIFRYDPNQAYNAADLYHGRWSIHDIGDDPTRGIAVDSLGFVYAAQEQGGVYALVPDLMPVGYSTHVGGSALPTSAARYIVDMTCSECTQYGMAVDVGGKLWTIHRGANQTDTVEDYATVIEPNLPDPLPAEINLDTITYDVHALEPPTASEPDRFKSATNLQNPYTYSDMTGVQLQLATGNFGSYQHIFEACDGQLGDPLWLELHWDAETPEGTHVNWFVRTANTEAELVDATFVAVGSEPPSTSPQAIDILLGEVNKKKPFLEVRVELVVDVPPEGGGIFTPTVRYFEAVYDCVSTTI